MNTLFKASIGSEVLEGRVEAGDCLILSNRTLSSPFPAADDDVPTFSSRFCPMHGVSDKRAVATISQQWGSFLCADHTSHTTNGGMC